MRLAGLVDSNPDCAEAVFLLATACRRNGDLDQVEAHLARAGLLGWDPAEIDRQRNLMVFQAGNFKSAGDEVKALLTEQANDDDAEECYEAVVRGYLSALLLNQADFILNGWIDWRPECAEPYLLRAELARLRSDVDDEIAAYRDILRFAPNDFEARRGLARAVMQRNDVSTAYELYSSCLRDRPNDAETLQGLADWHNRHGRPDEAKDLVAKLLETETDLRRRSAALNLWGQIALAEKDYVQAARVLKEASDADPSSVGIAYRLSQALSRGGQEEEASVYLARWKRLQEIEDELENMQGDILEHPEDPELRSRVGALLLEQGDEKAGVNWLISVLFYHPAHAKTNRLLADHYEKTGQSALAARHRALADGAQSTAVSPVTPESTVSESTVPESTAPESAAPESTAPESTAPESAADQVSAEQLTAEEVVQ